MSESARDPYVGINQHISQRANKEQHPTYTIGRIGKYGTNRYGHNEEFAKSMTADCSALCKTRQHSVPHRC